MADQDELMNQLVRAERFFRNDYHDRGMVKWQGYFLSDHTEDVGKYSKKQAIDRNRQDQVEMSQEAISQYLLKAFDQRFPVTIQLRNHTAGGLTSPFYHGKVMGFQEDNVVLSDNTQDFPMTDILWVGLG
ncbi:hypothetical protein AB0X56_06755 [Weissella paramesenteroides]|uniref:hypothetical protein n=1 Tax=Weissella paramesenteroides TaxID=1249 RepID=UPI003F244005